MADGPVATENQEIQKTAKADEASVDVKKPEEAPKIKSSTEKTSTSLEKDLRDHVEGKSALKDSPNVVESLESAEVKNLETKIYDFYNISNGARNSEYETEMYVVKDESLHKYRERDVRLFRYKEKRELKTEEEKAKFEQDVKAEAECIMGINKAITSNKGITLLKESSADEHTITHEIMHSMSRNNEDVRKSGLKTKLGNNLDEAVTEILTLQYEHPDLDAWDLYSRTLRGEIEVVGYPDQVAKLLAIIAYTDRKNPFTTKDLAKYYFHDVQVKDASCVDSMIREIIPRMPTILQENVGKYLSSDLQGDI